MSRDRAYLGFDFGRRRIGVAAGQTVTGSASPVATVHADREGRPDWDHIDRLVREWHPDGLVVGIPLHLDGAEQPETHAARGFAEQLAHRYGLPVHSADERLSSRAASAALAGARSAGAGRRTRKGDIDRMAARFILEDWLANRINDGDQP